VKTEHPANVFASFPVPGPARSLRSQRTEIRSQRTENGSSGSRGFQVT